LPREGTEAHTARAADIARRDVPTCRLGEAIGEVRDRVRASGADLCVVVDAARVVLGLLSRAAIQSADDGTPVEALMDAAPTTVRPNLPAGQLPEYRKRNVDHAVVTTCDGILVGVLRPEDAPAGGR
jgi:Mg/Co/Ni transporter MgtE